MDGLRRHIYLEEEFLFPPLRAAGMMAPLFVMVRQHGELWDAMRALDALLAVDADADADADAGGMELREGGCLSMPRPCCSVSAASASWPTDVAPRRFLAERGARRYPCVRMNCACMGTDLPAHAGD